MFVFFVEDQHLVRQGLKMMIEQDPMLRVIAEAGDGKEALQLFSHYPIDITLMDIRMPVMSGLEALRKIKSLRPEAKVLVLTTFNDDEYALEALKLGACGYLLKDAEPQKLIDSIHSALQGGLILHDHVAAKVMPRLLTKVETEEENKALPPLHQESERLSGLLVKGNPIRRLQRNYIFRWEQ